MNTPTPNEKIFKLRSFSTVELLADELVIKRFGFTKRLALSWINDISFWKSKSRKSCMIVISYSSGGEIASLSVSDSAEGERLITVLQNRIGHQVRPLSEDEKWRLARRNTLSEAAFVIVLLFGILVLICLAVEATDVIDGFIDTELTEIRVESLCQGKYPATNYIKVSGRLSEAFELTESYSTGGGRHKKTVHWGYLYYKADGQVMNRQLYGPGVDYDGVEVSKRSRTAYIALLPSSWQKGHDIRVLLKVKEDDIATLVKTMGTEITLTGMLQKSFMDNLRGAKKGDWNNLSDFTASRISDPMIIAMNKGPADYRKEIYIMLGASCGCFIFMYILIVLVTTRKNYHLYDPNENSGK